MKIRSNAGWRSPLTIDLRSLALLRIGLGLLLLADLAIRWPDLLAHYSDNGVLPRAAMESYFASRPGLLSLHMLFGSISGMTGLFAIAGAIAVAFTVGYRSKLTGFLSLLLLCSLQARNPLVLSDGDSLLRMLMFWLLFLPSGARFSIDAWLAEQSDRKPLEGDRLFSIGAAALLLQMAFVYWFSALLKDDPAWRSEGSALFIALSIDQFAKPLGHAMLSLPPVMLKVLTLATFWLEVLGPLAAFATAWNTRLRLGVIAVFLGFHLIALNLTMHLGLFPWVCAVGWLAFLPSAFWNESLPALRRAMRRLNPMLCKPSFVSALTKRIPSFRVRRSRLITNSLAGLALLFVVCWNVRSTNFELHEKWFPRTLNPIAQALRIEQYWSMFAPYPMHDDGWYVVRGALADGGDVDLITGQKLSWEKPKNVAASYPSQRWRKYSMNLRHDKYRDFRGAYVRYLIRNHGEETPLIAVELIYMQEDTLPMHFAEAPARPTIMFESIRPGVSIGSEMVASPDANSAGDED